MSDTKATEEAGTKKITTLHPCACLEGTGQVCPAVTRKAFAQDHDARMSSRLAQSVADKKMTMDQAEELLRKAGGSDLLIGKTKRSAQLRSTKGTGEKKATKATKANEAEQAIAKAAPTILGQTAKVFHGKRRFDATVVRNASDEMVARHRFIGKNCDHEVTFEDGEIFTK